MIEKGILDFLKSNIVATICCTDKDVPWCFNCFYTLKEKEMILIFKSSLDSKHHALLENNHKVAGTILPATINFAGLQGIQFEGVILDCNEYFLQVATNMYHTKFPVGKAMPGKISAIMLTTLKLTDNTKGFGYKTTWQRTLAMS